jgi:hypothetical protein
LALGGSRTTPMGHRGGSATPRPNGGGRPLHVVGHSMWPKGVARPPHQFFIFFSKKIFKIIYIIFLIFFLHVHTKGEWGFKLVTSGFIRRDPQQIELSFGDKNILIMYHV